MDELLMEDDERQLNELEDCSLALEALYAKINDFSAVSRADAEGLESLVPNALPKRYPAMSFTERPTAQNLGVALEAINLQTVTLIATLFAAIATLISKIISWFNGGSSSGSSSGGSSKPSKEANRIAATIDKAETALSDFEKIGKEVQDLGDDFFAFPKDKFYEITKGTIYQRITVQTDGSKKIEDEPFPVNYVRWYLFADNNRSKCNLYNSNYSMPELVEKTAAISAKCIVGINDMIDKFDPTDIQKYNTAYTKTSNEFFTDLLKEYQDFCSKSGITVSASVFDSESDLNGTQRIQAIWSNILQAAEGEEESGPKKVLATNAFREPTNQGGYQQMPYFDVARALARFMDMKNGSLYKDGATKAFVAVETLSKAAPDAIKVSKKIESFTKDNENLLSQTQIAEFRALGSASDAQVLQCGNIMKCIYELLEAPVREIIAWEKCYTAIVAAVKQWVKDGRPNK